MKCKDSAYREDNSYEGSEAGRKDSMCQADEGIECVTEGSKVRRVATEAGSTQVHVPIHVNGVLARRCVLAGGLREIGRVDQGSSGGEDSRATTGGEAF